MSWFARIEQACAAFIERTFAKTFPSDLEPAQIARKLVSTMEARTRGDEGHLLAPGSYLVYVSPDDFTRLAEHRAYLEREWAELLRDMAARVGVYFFDGGPNVEMVSRESIPLGHGRRRGCERRDDLDTERSGDHAAEALSSAHDERRTGLRRLFHRPQRPRSGAARRATSFWSIPASRAITPR